MIDRKHVEQLLAVNGLPATAADEEIRSVLISARWHKEDVETAITVLRENPDTHKTHVDTLHDVFMSDKKLSPEAIHALLGIDVEVDASELEKLRGRRQSTYVLQVISIFFIALAVAIGVVLGIMYTQGIGLFYVG